MEVTVDVKNAQATEETRGLRYINMVISSSLSFFSSNTIPLSSFAPGGKQNYGCPKDVLNRTTESNKSRQIFFHQEARKVFAIELAAVHSKV